MDINIRERFFKHKKTVVLIGLIVLIIGLALLSVDIFAETPANCIGTNMSTQHCCTCFAITASPGTISVGESSKLTLYIDNNPNAGSVDCSPNGFSAGDGTAICSINNGVLSNTVFNDGSYDYFVSPSNTITYTATCSGIGGTVTDNITVTVVDTTDPTISFNPPSRLWANTNVNVAVTASDSSGISATDYCWTTGVSCAPSTSFANGSTLTQSSNGSWTLCVKARDNFNNETTNCSGPYQIDKTKPTVDSFSVDGHTSNFNTYDTSLTIAWSVSDSGGSNLSNVEVWRQTDGGGWSKIHTESISGSSNSGSWTNTVTCGHNYGYGLHVFDKAGNLGIEGLPITATVQCNQAPTAINLAATEGDYCFSSLYIFLSWQFSDLDVGDTQDYYRVQIDDNSDFSSLEKDSGKVSTIGLPGPNYSYSPSLSFYNETYYWRLMVWDDKGGNSVWIYPGSSFDTPSHKYPEPAFIPSPQSPSVDEVVEFIDSSKCYNVAGSEYPCRNGGGVSYQWDFDYDAGEGFTLDSTYKGNATTTYATSEAYTIRLRVTDDLATCSTDRTINVTFPLPEWEEGAP